MTGHSLAKLVCLLKVARASTYKLVDLRCTETAMAVQTVYCFPERFLHRNIVLRRFKETSNVIWPIWERIVNIQLLRHHSA